MAEQAVSPMMQQYFEIKKQASQQRFCSTASVTSMKCSTTTR